MNAKLAEADRQRDHRRFKLEEDQKIKGWGATKWPTEADLKKVSNSEAETNSEVDSKPNATEDMSAVGNQRDHQMKMGKPKKRDQEKESSETGGDRPEDAINTVSCGWDMAVDDFSYAEPGCIGFNGHQAVFHCYNPTKPFIPREGRTDPCLLKLATLNEGIQVCTIIYNKPPPPPARLPRKVCTTDRQVTADLEDPCKVPEPPKVAEEKGTETEKGKKGDKGGKGKKGKKGKK